MANDSGHAVQLAPQSSRSISRYLARSGDALQLGRLLPQACTLAFLLQLVMIGRQKTSSSTI